MATSLTLSSEAIGWYLETPEDLATVLAAVQTYGYRGGIMGQTSTDGITWALELNPTSGVGVTATLGQWIVWWQSQITVMTSEQFAAAGFTVTGS